MYVRSCNRRIPRARLLDTNERNAAVCMVSPGERRRVDGTGFTGLHVTWTRFVAPHMLEDHPARQYEITFVRDSRPENRIEFNSESCVGYIGAMFLT